MSDELDIARDDLALDALAAGEMPDSHDSAFVLLHALRADLDLPAGVTPLRRRRPPSAALVALAAAAGLVVGGIAAGAVVAADRPGELLYAAHKVIAGERDRTAEVVALLDEASGALARGDRAGARRLLARARPLLGEVPAEADRELLRDRLAALAAFAVSPSPAPPKPSATRSPVPSPTRSEDRGGPGEDGSTREPSETPEPSRTSESGDDSGSGSGKGSGGSGSGSSDSGSSGSGSDD